MPTTFSKWGDNSCAEIDFPPIVTAEDPLPPPSTHPMVVNNRPPTTSTTPAARRTETQAEKNQHFRTSRETAVTVVEQPPAVSVGSHIPAFNNSVFQEWQQTNVNPLFGPNRVNNRSRGGAHSTSNPISTKSDFNRAKWLLTFEHPGVEAEFVVYYLSHRNLAIMYCVLATLTAVIGVAMYKNLPAMTLTLYSVVIAAWTVAAVTIYYLASRVDNEDGMREQPTTGRGDPSAPARSNDTVIFDFVGAPEQADASIASFAASVNATTQRRAMFLDDDPPHRRMHRENAKLHERITLVILAANFLFAIANFAGKGVCYNPVWTYDDELRGCRRAIQTDSVPLILLFTAAYTNPVRIVPFSIVYVVLIMVMFASRRAPTMIPVIEAYFWGSVAVYCAEVLVCIVSLYLRERRARDLFEIHVQRHQRAAEVEQIRRRTERMVAGHVPLEAARACAVRGGASSPQSNVLFAWSKRALVLGIGLRNFGAWSSRRGSADIVELLQLLTSRFDELHRRFDSLPSKYPAFGDTYLLMDASQTGLTDGSSPERLEGVSELYRFALAALTAGSALLERLLQRSPPAEDGDVPPMQFVACLEIGAGGGVVNMTANHYAVGPVVDGVLRRLHSWQDNESVHSNDARERTQRSSVLLVSQLLCSVLPASAIGREKIVVPYAATNVNPTNNNNEWSRLRVPQMRERPLIPSPTTDLSISPSPPTESLSSKSSAPGVHVRILPPLSGSSTNILSDDGVRGGSDSTNPVASGPWSIDAPPSRTTMTASKISVGLFGSNTHDTLMPQAGSPTTLTGTQLSVVQYNLATPTESETDLMRNVKAPEGSRIPAFLVSGGGGEMASVSTSPTMTSPRRGGGKKTSDAQQRVELVREWWFITFRFADPVTESYFRKVQCSFTALELKWSLTGSLWSVFALIVICSVDELLSMTWSQPLLWTSLCGLLCIACLLIAVLFGAHITTRPWTAISASFIIQACYLAAVAAGKRNTILGDSQMIWLVVQLHWMLNRPQWLTPFWLCTQDVIVAILFILRTWLLFDIGKPSSMYQLTLFVEFFIIVCLLAYRAISDYTKRQIFAEECHLELLKKELEEDYKDLAKALQRIVPRGVAGTLVQRARARSQGVVRHHLHPLWSTSLGTSTNEVPFLLLQLNVTDIEDPLKHTSYTTACMNLVASTLRSRDSYERAIQLVKVSHDTVLLCAGGITGDSAAPADYDETRAVVIVCFTSELAEALDKMSSVRYRAVIGSGYLMGSVVGRVGVTFDYYGAAMARALALVSALSWGSIAGVTRLVDLYRSYMKGRAESPFGKNTDEWIDASCIVSTSASTPLTQTTTPTTPRFLDITSTVRVPGFTRFRCYTLVQPHQQHQKKAARETVFDM